MDQVILDVEAGTAAHLSVFMFPTVGENPLPRSGHRIMADDGNIYAIGGYIQFPDRLIVKGEVRRC